MSKKIAIIGKGTAGSISAAFYSYYTDYEIDWFYDNNIKTQAVGEGSTLEFPVLLNDSLDFNIFDLNTIDGTHKHGILKENWSFKNKKFFHPFPPSRCGYHFNALKLQDFISKKLECNSKIRMIDKNIDSENIDADFIVDCSGRPSVDSLTKNFIEPQFVPVNAVHVTQCFWDYCKFNYTLAIARPHGWVFGIPLQNRCSIGYMYNHNLSFLDEVKEDVKHIFEDYNLTPSNVNNSFHFYNYYRKQNFSNRIFYNGNASFFLEPLEATSISLITIINRLALDVINEKTNHDFANAFYLRKIYEIEKMLMVHYAAGSLYETNFWSYAKNRGEQSMLALMEDNHFVEWYNKSNKKNFSETYGDFGLWTATSYKLHFDALLP